MPFQSKREKLILSEEEIKELTEITHSYTASICYVDRAKMLLEYHEGMNISQIARSHKTYRAKVERQVDKALCQTDTTPFALEYFYTAKILHKSVQSILVKQYHCLP